MRRRSVLQWSMLAGAAALTSGSAWASGFEWRNATIRSLGEALAAGKVTSRALCEAYLARIAALNPTLNAILEVNSEALAIADALDRERASTGARGPLHGIPLVVKDNLDTGDTMETTAGSLALLGSKAPHDAFVVTRLRAAGAVVLAKSNLSEWANMRSTRSSSGWSARGGQGHNAYSFERSPLGSSSGSGIAVAADLCAAAVGTETDGSIVAPSSVEALVGLKPTVGLLSRTGIIPISATQDTPGPMTRTVEDAALLLAAMMGDDSEDPAVQAAGRKAEKDYTRFLDKDGLKGARIGVAAKLAGAVPGVQRLFAAAKADMARLGAVMVEGVELEVNSLFDSESEVLLFELKAGMASYLSKRRPGSPMKSLADLIAFNVKNAEREMPQFGQELFEQAQARGPLTDPKYRRALEVCRLGARTKGIDAAMKKHRLDAIIAPTMDPAWLIDPVFGDRSAAAAYSAAAMAGYPSLTVPMGDTAGLPVGLLFFASAWSEGALLRFGYAYEQGTLHRRPPTL
jgi:amidase